MLIFKLSKMLGFLRNESDLHPTVSNFYRPEFMGAMSRPSFNFNNRWWPASKLVASEWSPFRSLNTPIRPQPFPQADFGNIFTSFTALLL